jgi:hypothetical protein
MIEDVVNRTWVPCENCEDKPDKNNRTAIRKRQNHKTIQTRTYYMFRNLRTTASLNDKIKNGI